MNVDPSRFATPRVAAGVLIADAADRVLMLRTTYKDAWEIPGGYIDRGELPSEACLRELGEELGLSRPVGRLLAVDWAPHPEEGDKLLFIFDGGTCPRTRSPSFPSLTARSPQPSTSPLTSWTRSLFPA
ncbi:NUDIX hydrolase [Pilimelia columellifera]|uniref:Nudix hydrolase domain-containing protein n=1 Tax=Pilimelia columellifera subsp. columellifera TaxID=706583 RepID=A0ABN3MW72_9ACTN